MLKLPNCPFGAARKSFKWIGFSYWIRKFTRGFSLRKFLPGAVGKDLLAMPHCQFFPGFLYFTRGLL